MNKTIATAAIVGAAILSPVASMGITPVREALLGLAPEDQIVALADKIDESRVENEQKQTENEQKLTDLQASLDAANTVIAEQKKTLEGQSEKNAAVEKALVEQKADSDKKAECAMTYASHPYCKADAYRTKSGFESEKSNINKSENEEIKKEELKRAAERYGECQEIIAKCG
jgi:hypothetical protein